MTSERDQDEVQTKVKQLRRRTSRNSSFLVATVLTLLIGGDATGQTSSTAKEVWPKLTATIELWPRSRVQLWGEKQDGEDFDFNQWNIGALFSYRMKRMLKVRQHDIDEENEHNLVLGGGYEYLQTNQNDKIKREHRIILQATPKYIPGAGVLVQDRNRVEFRWNDGTYDFRYRNKLTIDRPFQAERVSLYAVRRG